MLNASCKREREDKTVKLKPFTDEAQTALFNP
jgi:hypothetical protein